MRREKINNCSHSSGTTPGQGQHQLSALDSNSKLSEDLASNAVQGNTTIIDVCFQGGECCVGITGTTTRVGNR